MHIWASNVLLVQIAKGNSARKDANAKLANKSYSSSPVLQRYTSIYKISFYLNFETKN